MELVQQGHQRPPDQSDVAQRRWGAVIPAKPTKNRGHCLASFRPLIPNHFNRHTAEARCYRWMNKFAVDDSMVELQFAASLHS